MPRRGSHLALTMVQDVKKEKRGQTGSLVCNPSSPSDPFAYPSALFSNQKGFFFHLIWFIRLQQAIRAIAI
jgi:hypothetical protein